MNNIKDLCNFSVKIYGELEKYNEVISKARVRIFYRGFNRNSTYITDEFAEKLIASLPYSPIKGIYDYEEEDYTDHGERRDLGRAYGVVPYPSNFAWEKHLDEDGIEREYACADVLLWTGLYKEASEILNKGQSMEIYPPSIKGEWKVIEGKQCYCYEEGVFLGLQVLGDKVEPCFEGSSFYSLFSSMNLLLEEIKKLNNYFPNNFSLLKEGGKNKMDSVNFKLSDQQKYEAIWKLLNTDFTEENNYTITYCINDIYDDYALVYNIEHQEYERVYYSKDDSNDSLTLGKRKKCYILDVTEEEKGFLNDLRNLSNNNYELVIERFKDYEKLNNEISSKDIKIAELDESISTLNQEKEEKDRLISDLEKDNESLKEFKLNKENEEKLKIINKYSLQLDEEIINNYKEKISDYSLIDLEKDLSYELVKNNPVIFSKKDSMIFKHENNNDSFTDLLDKYVKK